MCHLLKKSKRPSMQVKDSQHRSMNHIMWSMNHIMFYFFLCRPRLVSISRRVSWPTFCGKLQCEILTSRRWIHMFIYIYLYLCPKGASASMSITAIWQHLWGGGYMHVIWEEDTCTSYEEEDTCMSMHVPFHTNTISFFFFLAPAIPMPISFCCFPILMPSDSFFWRQLQRAEKNREALRSQESGGPVEVEVCSNVVFFCY